MAGVSVAGSHRPGKPAFCQYRQGKLVNDDDDDDHDNDDDNDDMHVI